MATDLTSKDGRTLILINDRTIWVRTVTDEGGGETEQYPLDQVVICLRASTEASLEVNGRYIRLNIFLVEAINLANQLNIRRVPIGNQWSF